MRHRQGCRVFLSHNCEARVQLFEAQETRPRTSRHEHKECALLLLAELLDHAPKHLDGGVVVLISAIACVVAQVVDVYLPAAGD